MNQTIATILNPILAIFGLKIIRVHIGHWSGSPLVRTVHPLGWRLARRPQYQGLPEDATELDRFMAEQGMHYSQP